MNVPSVTIGQRVAALEAAVALLQSASLVLPANTLDGQGVLFRGTDGHELQRALGTGMVMRTIGVDAILPFGILRNPTLTEPDDVQPGDCWVEASGVSPSRVFALKCLDSDGQYVTIATVTV